jgi:hydrogenase maturation protease
VTNKPLILFLGNSILSDDRIGLIIGEKLKERLESEGNEVQVLEKSGVSLIDYFEGRDHVIIVDSVESVGKRAGDIVSLTLDDLLRCPPMSSHYLGLPESVRLMNSLGIEQPKQLRILGIAVDNTLTVSEKISENLENELPKLETEIHNAICSMTNQNVGMVSHV